MQNAQSVLSYAFLVGVGVGAILNIKKGASAYAATLGEGKFKYEFDSKKIPMLITALFALACTSFIFGLIVGQQLGLAIEFALGVTVFGGIGLVLLICLVPKRN